MADQSPCIRCERMIDAYAKICPYCNWDRAQGTPPPMPIAAPHPIAPPVMTWWEALIKRVADDGNPVRLRVLAAAGIVLLLGGAFAIGVLVHGGDPPESKVDAAEATAAPPNAPPRANVTLVPVNDLEQPITSAPPLAAAAGVPPEYQRSDATAVSSEEYTQLAARARAEKKVAGLIDPRTLTAPAYRGAPPRPRRALAPPDAPISMTTRPVPQYQPLPEVHVSRSMTARFVLTVGADGRVKEVNVKQLIPGESAKLIAALQAWRFKPATLNGTAVEAPFSVDISFHGND